MQRGVGEALLADGAEEGKADRAVEVDVDLEAEEGGQGGRQGVQDSDAGLQALHDEMHNEMGQGRPATEGGAVAAGDEILLQGVPQARPDAQGMERRACIAQRMDIGERARDLVQDALPVAVVAERHARDVQEQLLQARVCAHELGEGLEVGGSEQQLPQVVHVVELHHRAVALLHAHRDVGERRRVDSERVRARHFELQLGAGREVEGHGLGGCREAEAEDLQVGRGEAGLLDAEDADER